MKDHIRSSLTEAQSALENLLSNEQQLGNIEQAAQLLVHALENGKTIFSCGNGGSMCDAMHFAEELTGRYRKNRKGHAAVSISDPSHISCVANDFGYEYIFSRYIESHASEGDVLLGISTSGTSKNVIQAAKVAKELGVHSIILSGREAQELESLAKVYICTKGGDFADRVQELHIKILHIFIELIERSFHPENYQ
ncbi:D-sedoheptulose 7-phosphate isomerase [Arenicella sp. 4NH20-0111]|uniref:SIS domain-containing protein n=1 Tax=Arenicella sp. 4NH20-0111 TaxID=3127648 RepID=UPI00310BB2BD